MEKEMTKNKEFDEVLVAEKPVVKTLADKIWDDIKEKPVEMFALPKQFVHMYCKQIKIEPSKLYLTFTVPAILPALEVALEGKYTVERLERYISVSPIVEKM